MRPTQQNDVFHAIAHPARRAILIKLRASECAANELVEPFEMTFAAISQHLRILENAELVAARREGRYRLYRLKPEPLLDVLRWSSEFAAFFEQRLDALGEHLDRKHSKATLRGDRGISNK
ncbi:MAG: metalloregulator ArsR/SmtB family transcription factor [Acidobacteriota bacterium]|nr:metalloregulator ArsR/SmtB family transcription factor [Acidobacteriota bacterium]